jgi:hypothetical protein
MRRAKQTWLEGLSCTKPHRRQLDDNNKQVLSTGLLAVLSKCSSISMGFLDVELAAGVAAEEMIKVQPQVIAVLSDLFSYFGAPGRISIRPGMLG